jgi:tricorn protease
MKKLTAFLLLNAGIFSQLQAQIDAGLFRFPDVSKTQIVFTYGDDIWVMPKEGGTAEKLSSPVGIERFPKFSPDGQSIAFTGNYDGNQDVYVLPTKGGVPVRLTEHGYSDRVVEWQPDGKKVLFASGRESGRDRFSQFYTVPAAGGASEKLPFPYAEFGSYSPDGKQMALVFVSQAFRNWKRYRGGWKANIHLFNFTTQASEDISLNETAGNEFPMWHGDYIYFLSDRGAEQRMNLWRYTVSSKKFEQLTNFKDYDIHFPSLGPDDIVFEQAGKLYLFSLANQQLKEVKVTVLTDKASLKAKLVNASNDILSYNVSPDGNRVVIEARGEIFSLPAENGSVKDLTRTSGVAERYPAWSPDGKTIAYWSDQTGEYELWLRDANKETAPRKITNNGPGYRYSLYWSPDSKKLAFIDQAMKIKMIDIASGATSEIDQALRFMHGGCEGFTCSWSPDSRYITYSRDLENSHNAVFIFDSKDKKKYQITNGFYSCNNPVFDAEGKYIYLTTNQSFSPYYSDIDNSFIYANSSQVGVISLKKSTKSLFYAKNDTVAIKQDDKKDTAKSSDKKKDKKNDKKSEDKTEDDKSAVTPVDIDFDGLETRMELLPIPPGNYGNIGSTKGKILYVKYPNTGSSDINSPIKYFDIDKREEKTILDDARGFTITADGEKLLVSKGGNYAVVKPEEGQKMDKLIPVSQMMMLVDPVQEWKQLFTDAWRMERDYFYDPNMHGVDWNLVKERYSKMLDGALTRDEVNFIIGEMLGELNASHTYKSGGDYTKEKNTDVGYLGVDWQADGNFYKIKTIPRAAIWDAEARSALDQPGVEIKQGDYILAVNGVPLTTAQEPYALFQGLDKKTVELTYNSTPTFTGATTAIVQTMDDEYRLRFLAWVEANRKRVEVATNGEAGYIYVPSTGTDGQQELTRQLNAQSDKKSLIIDERFNSGGQIPDRFIEMLNREPLAYWATRDGKPWAWPPYANFGPKVMLINGWSGSGGDAFPDFFRKKGLGPLIGTRTWGGLIGISGMPSLIDGGSVTAPSFRMYNPDGTWFKEGHGVEPDIMVDEDLSAMAKGTDPQLERAITEIKKALKEKPYLAPKQPAYEKRN